MESLKDRIEKHLSENDDSLPWPCTKEENLSTRAQRALKLLNQAEKLVISSCSPFKEERKRIIRKLNSLGVTQSALSEMSGLSKSAIGRVITSGKTEE